MKMEWNEDHDFQLAEEFLVSEPYRFKPRAVWARLPAVRTVKRAKIWQYVDRKKVQWSDEHSLSSIKALNYISANKRTKFSSDMKPS